MHDDEFDRRRTGRDPAAELDVERTKVPGKQTLVEAEQDRSIHTPAVPGKRTLVEGLGAWTQGLAEARDPAVEIEFHVRKARELICKLAAKPPPSEARIAHADLRCHLQDAQQMAARCGSDPRARDAVASMFQVVIDAQPFVDTTRSAAPESIARRGIEGPGERMPFHDQIQRAFASHNISGIRAHVGSPAADASRALGAHAYAHGSDVAFASPPSLRLAAHEAAHVVQQRTGVSLKAMDGGSGDSHEQHADAVADAVVRGESAEKLLDQKAGAAPAVQREERDTPAPLAHDKFSAKMDYELFKAEQAGQNVSAPAFVHLHIAELRRDIDVFLLSRNLSTGVPEVTFTPDIGAFLTALFAAFDKDDNAAKLTRLRTWVAPADLYKIVDRNRPILEADKQKTAPWSGNPNDALAYEHCRKGPPLYANAVAVGIGSVLEERLLASLKRIAQQLVAATAKHRAAGKDTPVAANELVPAHPLDWQVALAMVGRGEPTVQVAGGTLGPGAGAQVKYRKVTRIEWQGALGGPWNAVRVEPSDAGPEAVAAEVLGASTEAYRVRRVGTYFLIPEDQAIRFPQALLFRRAGQRDAVQDLAYGRNAMQIERAEAERSLPADSKAPTSGELQKQWQEIHDQLLGISAVVRPYTLDAELGLALSRHAVHAADLASLSGHDAAVRGQLFTKQAGLLDRIAAQVAALTASAPAPKPGPSWKALHDVLAKLVRVVNLSHLPETGEAAMGEVVAAQRAAVPDALEAALGDIATQIEIAREIGGQALQAQHRSQGTYGASLAERADALRQRVAVFRSQMLRDKADASELEALGRDVDALRFEAGVIAEVGQLGQLFEVLDKLEDGGWVLVSEALTAKIGETSDDNHIGRLETARRGSLDLRRELNLIHGEWLDIEKTAQSIEANLAKGGVKDADAKARALVQPRITAIQLKLKKLGGEEAVQTFLKDAYDKVDSAQTRAMIVQIATMIGVAVIAGGAGEFAGGVAEGLGAGSLGVWAVSLTAETAAFTAIQAELTGEPMLAAFVNNGIGNLLTFGAMKGVGKAVEASETFGWTLKGAKAGAKVRTAALAIAKAGELTAQTLVAQGIQIAQAEYENMRATGHAMSTHELEMTAAQGMAMMIGTAIAHRILGDPALGAHALGRELGARIAKLRAMSATVTSGGDSAQAVALMQQTRALVEDIGTRARDLSAKTDHELASLGYTRQQVEALAKFAGTQSKALAAMDAGSFAAQLGLHTVVPGRVFSGTAAEIEPVLRDFASRGYAVEPTREGYRVAKKDEPAIDLFARPDEKMSAGIGQHPANAPDATARESIHGQLSPAEAGVNHTASLRARAEMRSRSSQLENSIVSAAVEGHVMTKLRRIVCGTGLAAAMDANTLPGAQKGVDPNPLRGIPDTIGVGTGADTFTKLGDTTIGQTAHELDSAGFAVQPSELTTDHSGYTSARNVADATALTQYRSGVPVLDGKIVEVSITRDSTWRVNGANVRIRVQTNSGEVFLYADATDLATGAGAPRELDPGQVSADPGKAAEYKATLEKSGRIAYGDDPTQQKAGKILVSGGSATGAWNCQIARTMGADVDWIARDTGQAPGMAAAKPEYQQNQAKLEGGGLSPDEAMRLVERQAQLRAFDAAMLPRNITSHDAAFKDPGVKRMVKQIKTMTPTEAIPGEPPGRVKVEFTDGNSAIYDQVIVAHGTNPATPAHPGPGGALTLTQGMMLRPVVVDGQVVALETVDPPGAVRVLGAAMWSPGWFPRIDPPMLDVYTHALRNQSVNAPPDSPANPLIHNVGKQIPAANRGLRAD